MKTTLPSGAIEYTDESGFEEGVEQAVRSAFWKGIVWGRVVPAAGVVVLIALGIVGALYYCRG